jgi:hypothetical protein
LKQAKAAQAAKMEMMNQVIAATQVMTALSFININKNSKRKNQILNNRLLSIINNRH